MRKFLLSAIALGFVCYASYAQQNIVAANPDVTKGQLIRVASPDHPIHGWKNQGVLSSDGQMPRPDYDPKPDFPNVKQGKDGAVQGAPGSSSVASSAAGFDGQGYTQVCPADPTMAVGLTEAVQMINGASGAYIQVFNKTGGTIKAKFYMDAITGKGGLGDPVVLYDQFADRFIFTEFANKSETGSEGLIIAVTKTSAAEGAWNVYFYPSTLFPDYPKYSIWNNALYCKVNEFRRNTYQGASVYAFDKAAMFSGAATATSVRISLGKANKYYSMCPVGLVGTTQAVTGTGGLFAYLNDNSWSGSAKDSIGLVEFKVNFTSPASSVVAQKASLVTTDYNLGSGTVPQPNGGQGLDALRNRVMNQPVYRNFGTTQSIALCYTVTANTQTGVRWYELTSSGGAFTIKQQSTYAPDANYRWMPSINIDPIGDIAIGYNIASSTIYPGLRYTGRLVTDPLNTMTIAEGTIVSGTASSSCSGRYGDYNHLVMDPDPNANTTFWFTGMYNKASSWSTYIGSFSFTAPAPLIAGTNTASMLNAIKATIYPNPVKDVLNVQLSGGKNVSINIVDLAGRILKHQDVSSAATRVSVSDLVAGTYILQINNGTTTTIQKFVKN